MEPWEREMLRELRDPICRCGRPKIKGHSKAAFCYGCWKLLPAQIKRALFREFGSGPLSYQEARIAAGHFFKEESYLRFDMTEEFAEVLGP
jgi:hypothetical protein